MLTSKLQLGFMAAIIKITMGNCVKPRECNLCDLTPNEGVDLRIDVHVWTLFCLIEGGGIDPQTFSNDSQREFYYS